MSASRYTTGTHTRLSPDCRNSSKPKAGPALRNASGQSPSCLAGCLGGVDCLRAGRRSWTARVRPRRLARSAAASPASLRRTGRPSATIATASPGSYSAMPSACRNCRYRPLRCGKQCMPLPAERSSRARLGGKASAHPAGRGAGLGGGATQSHGRCGDDRFEKAAEERLGEDGVRAAIRSALDGFPRSVPGMEQAPCQLGR